MMMMQRIKKKFFRYVTADMKHIKYDLVSCDHYLVPKYDKFIVPRTVKNSFYCPLTDMNVRI
jgi:hypothetical protein